MRYIHWHIPSAHYVVTHTYKHMMILCLCDIFHFKQGRVGRDTKRFDLVVCSSRPVRCTRPHVGVIHMYMMSATCSPEKKSKCNGTTMLCLETQRTFQLDITLVRRRGKTVVHSSDGSFVLHILFYFIILSLRCCMLFSPLRVGCARDARVCILHLCQTI